MGVIVRSLGTPRSAEEDFGSTWERRRQVWERLGAPAASLGAPRITVEQSRENNIPFRNAAGAPRNHSYYLSFNDF